MTDSEIRCADPTHIWVASAPGATGSGTPDDPCSLIKALERAQPGQTIVLSGGDYHGDCSFQLSGTIDRPITIRPAQDCTVRVVEGCWYFYDTSDLIVQGIDFVDAPLGALALIGACERNRFTRLSFTDCGGRRSEGCTFYIGGDGAACNLIDSCSFNLSSCTGERNRTSIALMLAEGDPSRSGRLIRHHILRNNTFSNYGCAIVAGSRGVAAAQFGHRIEGNRIEDCHIDGMRIKCGDTHVAGNHILRCAASAISLNGDASCIESNRIEACATGIRVLGQGHTIQNNCLIDCVRHAVHICTASSEEGGRAAGNILVEQNSCIVDPPDAQPGRGVACETGTSAVIRSNLFAGISQPYPAPAADGAPALIAACDNGSLDPVSLPGGCEAVTTDFCDRINGNYENNLSCGAHGWPVSGNPCVEEAPLPPTDSYDFDDDESETEVDEIPASDIDLARIQSGEDEPEAFYFKAGFYSPQLPSLSDDDS